MKRVTVAADEELLERVRRIARDEGVSLASVIRQGMEMRAEPRRLSFIGAGSSKPGLPPVDWNADMVFEPPPWRS